MEGKNKKDIGEHIIGSLATTYMAKINEIINVAFEMTNNVADYIFNIKLSISILKGGIKDLKTSILSREIHSEIENIHTNISDSINAIKMARIKLDNIKKLSDDCPLTKDIQKKHLNRFYQFIEIVEKFMNIFYNKVLIEEQKLMALLRKESLKKMTEEDIDRWYNTIVFANNNGFKMVKISKNNINKMKEHINEYKNNIQNERKIQTILQEINTGTFMDEPEQKVDISFLKKGMIISKDLYDIKGNKLKNAYEMITEADLIKLYDLNYKNLYFKSPLGGEKLKNSDYRIVLIDDDSIITDLVGEFLTDVNFNVTAYNEPVKAIEIIRNDFPDLIILDVRMPGMDGIEFLETFKNLGNKKKKKDNKLKVPIMMLTSEKDEATVRKTIELGAVDFTPKPVDKNVLLKKIYKILSLKN